MRVFSVSLSLLVAVGLSLAGNGLLGTLSALRLADAAVPSGLTGLVLAMYYAGLMVGTLLLGATVARVGHIRSFAAFTALAVFAALAQGLTPPGGLWLPLRALTGLCMAGTYMTVESWLNAEAAPQSRGRVLAAYLVALYLGTGAGQLLIPVWPSVGLESFALAALLTSLAVVPICLTRVSAPALEPAVRLPPGELVRDAPVGWGGALLSGFVGATIFANAPLFARANGLSSDEVGGLMAAFVAGGLVGQWPLGWLSDRMDRRLVLVGTVLGLAGICAAFLAVASDPSRLWWALAFGFGALAFALYPLAVAHTIDRVGPRRALPAAGQLLLASSVGAFSAPILVAAASPWLGAQAFITIDALGMLVFAFVASTRVLRIDPVPQGPFQPMARTTLAAHELDPRGGDPPAPPSSPGPALPAHPETLGESP
jgi:MFS family permease